MGHRSRMAVGSRQLRRFWPSLREAGMTAVEKAIDSYGVGKQMRGSLHCALRAPVGMTAVGRDYPAAEAAPLPVSAG